MHLHGALLEFWSMRTSDEHVLNRESNWKEVLMARKFGNNRNQHQPRRSWRDEFQSCQHVGEGAVDVGQGDGADLAEISGENIDCRIGCDTGFGFSSGLFYHCAYEAAVAG